MSERVTTKYCGGCRQLKSLDAYAAHRYTVDGLQSRCRACCNAYGKAWRATHPKHRVSERRTEA